MLIRFVWVGRTRPGPAATWIEEYRRRISRSCPVEIVEVRDASGVGKSRARRESRSLAGKSSGRGFVVALDERGDAMTSAAFAAFLERALGRAPEVSFVMGGPEGLTEELVRGADARISLSRMTLPHELARVVLLEQVYRAFSILKGTPYHR